MNPTVAINFANDLDRLRFRKHCQEVFGEMWGEEWKMKTALEKALSISNVRPDQRAILDNF